MSARVMQAPPDLPPLMGRIEGGVTRAPHPRPSKLLHPGDPTLIPSPKGRETRSALHIARPQHQERKTGGTLHDGPPSPEGRETCCALHGPREQNP